MTIQNIAGWQKNRLDVSSGMFGGGASTGHSTRLG
jgi:hypothetical protein